MAGGYTRPAHPGNEDNKEQEKTMQKQEALAGEKAWKWHPDTVAGKWHPEKARAVKKAIALGYGGLTYHDATDCLSAMVWLGDRQARMAIYARGEWLLD